jgi:voltage-gated sodium channel
MAPRSPKSPGGRGQQAKIAFQAEEEFYDDEPGSPGSRSPKHSTSHQKLDKRPSDKSVVTRKSEREKAAPPKSRYEEISDKILSHFAWNFFVSLNALGNMVAIGLEVDFGCLHGEKCKGKQWSNIDLLFVISFQIELFTRIALMRMKYFRGDAFRGDSISDEIRRIEVGNIVDLILVQLRLVAFVVDITGTPTVIKMITVVRVINIAAAMRAFNLRALRELNLILVSLGDTFKAVGWVFAVLTLVSYVFAIVMTEIVGKNKDLTSKLSYARVSQWSVQDYWGSVPKSLYTLLQIMTLDQWSSHVVRPIVINQRIDPRVRIMIVVLFLIFLCISVVCLLNLITGVVVESTLSSARVRAEREAMEQQEICEKVMSSLEAIFEEADEDKSGEIDREELQGMLRDPKVRDRLKMLDIPLKDFDNLFSLLDDQGRGSVPIDKYFRGASRLRGHATSLDLYNMSVDLNKHKETCTKLVDKVDANNDVLAKLLDDVDIVDRDIIRGDGDDKDPVLKARKNRKATLTRSERLRGRQSIYENDGDDESSHGEEGQSVATRSKETAAHGGAPSLRNAALTDQTRTHGFSGQVALMPNQPAYAIKDADEFYRQKWIAIPETTQRSLEDKPVMFRS